MQVFTFCQNTNLRNNYTTVDTDDWYEARKIISESVVGMHFAFQYNSLEEAGVEKWGLTYIPLERIEKVAIVR